MEEYMGKAKGPRERDVRDTEQLDDDDDRVRDGLRNGDDNARRDITDKEDKESDMRQSK